MLVHGLGDGIDLIWFGTSNRIHGVQVNGCKHEHHGEQCEQIDNSAKDEVTQNGHKQNLNGGSESFQYRIQAFQKERSGYASKRSIYEDHPDNGLRQKGHIAQWTGVRGEDQQEEIANYGVAVHENVLDVNIGLGAGILENVLVEDARKAWAKDLRQDEHQIDGEKCIGAWRCCLGLAQFFDQTTGGEHDERAPLQKGQPLLEHNLIDDPGDYVAKLEQNEISGRIVVGQIDVGQIVVQTVQARWDHVEQANSKIGFDFSPQLRQGTFLV